MIEASIAAVPDLVIIFLVLAAIVGVPTALISKARNKPWPLRAGLAVYLSGIVAVTLLPGDAGLDAGQCDTGMPTHLFTSLSSLLNMALFAPAALLAVLLFRRPVTVAAGFVCLSGAVELTQSVAHLGRSCTLEDIAANATGAALGSLAGAVYLRWRRESVRRPVRDLLWGALVAGLGAVAMVSFFDSRIQPVDIVAMDDHRRDLAESSIEANEWISTAAVGVFGSDTQVQQTSTEKSGKRLKITAETNRGSITGWWPEKNLERAWSSNTRGDEGSLNKKQVALAADKFVTKWFPKSVPGSKQLIRSMGDGPTLAYLVTYRRYSHGVMMPMRLDLTITTKARVIGFVSRAVDDPTMPSATVDEKEARNVAHKTTGQPTESTMLLAQQVHGKWRPVWFVGSGKRDVVIDAVTGRVVPDAE